MARSSVPRVPNLPSLLKSKIYKTGQTRGADDDVIFQNRVSRNSTVLVPYSHWAKAYVLPEGEEAFENGFICLISPDTFFGTPGIERELAEYDLELGQNALVFYETRSQWDRFNPERRGWTPASSRRPPLNGQYVARVPGLTAIEGGERISRGFNTTANKGAGIRLYEYAGTPTIRAARDQLEALFWLCEDALSIVIENDMLEADALRRKAHILAVCEEAGNLDRQRLEANRILDSAGKTVCPLCLERLSGAGFFNKVRQAEGREVSDLTVTQVNLFHIREIQYGHYNHVPYNLGWGHHHCNVVVKDSGIRETLEWMSAVVDRNVEAGFLNRRD
ncbi:BstXI family restriction endonuclease [Methylobacterium gregans]|jgi:BstXI restriction endonuclease|uniref:Restriction endonuclease n=1 Tax=Methylobacterium gregans TaxID=374424 RepID=A0AA37HRG1_9HYPH|nr:BstXI family restriction endonuclease [Methylobacterium gregans]MDQ0522414.1 hypothetical protein [Methylobacterium gregans]GJD79582.1 hypothetical protein NBEOAGPD_2811 [Methylobacterium gregans]GLS55159.1 hypothetical protein GCM10007886_33430 [Methylobacterium gregans]